MTRPPGAADLRGFTLLEVMVVLSLLGLLAQGMVVALGAIERRDHDRAVEALRARLDVAVERAWIRGQTLAFERTPNGYRFVVTGADGAWQAVADSATLAPRTLPEGLRWSTPDSGEREPADDGPLLLSGREVPPFRLRLTAADGRTHVIVGRHGMIERTTGSEDR